MKKTFPRIFMFMAGSCAVLVAEEEPGTANPSDEILVKE